MILLVQGRATEAPKPPQIAPQRRKFMVAADCKNGEDAKSKAEAALTATGYSFITIDQIYSLNNEPKEPVLAKIVDEARRNGIGFAIYR